MMGDTPILLGDDMTEQELSDTVAEHKETQMVDAIMRLLAGSHVDDDAPF
jgi:hypothetical protein